MTVFKHVFTVPANTPSNNLHQEKVQIEGEMLTEIRVRIPPGHAGLAYMRIRYGSEQWWPKPEGKWLSGDDEIIIIQDNWQLPEYKTNLTLEGYNLDTTYAHSFHILITVKSLEDAKPLDILRDFVKILKKLLGV